MPIPLRLLAILAALGLAASQAGAQGRCLALADSAPAPLRHRIVPVALQPDEVRIRFVGHSTFLIESPQGVVAATDYAGYAGGVLPRIVTMNRAHTSHFTPSPDPAIEYVLRGWNPEGGPARHDVTIDDVYIRNVTTDIRGGFAGRVRDGNSIFIFEIADLCIGHLGHLHHLLAPGDLGWIGQLDIVMVAVDGTFTLDQPGVVETLKVLKARLILPMHYFGASTLNAFLANLPEDDFDVEVSTDPEIVVSSATLPDRPKVLVLPGF